MKKKDKYENMKENVKTSSEKQENMRLSSVNSNLKKITRLQKIYVTGDSTG